MTIFKSTNCIGCGKQFTPNNANNKYCSIECRYWSKVDKKSDDECWNWLGASSHKNGYGMLRVYGKGVKAHQLSWIIHFGSIPHMSNTYHGVCVLHTCDNKACCNPKHLYLGTHHDNMQDMVKRNRRRSYAGINNPASVLDKHKVAEIKVLSKLGMSSRSIASEYCVGQNTVLRVRNNVTYTDMR